MQRTASSKGTDRGTRNLRRTHPHHVRVRMEAAALEWAAQGAAIGSWGDPDRPRFTPRQRRLLKRIRTKKRRAFPRDRIPSI
ncbi:MAG: hypothetical protein AB1941_00855 [Gemmatimonadota bacterium]